MLIGCGRCASPRDGARAIGVFGQTWYMNLSLVLPRCFLHTTISCASLQYGLVTSLHRRSCAPGLCPRGTGPPHLVPTGQSEHGPGSIDLREIHLRELPEASRQVWVGSTGCAGELLQNTGTTPQVTVQRVQEAHLVQATVYDATRRRLLHGREDMLGLVAAQLKHKIESKEIKAGKAVWVDVSLGP